MNEFKEGLKIERKKSGEILITEQLEKLLIELMKGNISKNDVRGKGIAGKTTVDLKIAELVANKPNLEPLYNEYMSRKRENFEGYNFRPEAIEMLRTDCSQSLMAERIGISRRSFSTQIKKLQEKNKENILGELLKKHAERKMKRQKLEDEELIDINLKLDEYEEQFPVSVSKYEKRNSLEIRRENLQRVIDLVEELMRDGMTLKQISQNRIISEFNYRRYKSELESLSKILDNKTDNENKGDR